MKTSYALFAALAFAAIPAWNANAQVASENDFEGKVMVIHHSNGSITEFDATTVEYIDFRDATVEPEVPADPKVGDYFYSDGTWSDGGLISINDDGTDPVWAENRPAPIEGKTVIGIVCNVNQDRIADADKEAGFTHGYVLACKNAFDPRIRYNGEPFTSVQWMLDPDFEQTQVVKSCKSWYQNLDGRANTNTVLELYGDDTVNQAPAFYYSSTGFSVQAPQSTSGWFLPSTGQLWDAFANFCGNDVAAMMKTWQTISYAVDYGYNDTDPAGENPLDLFNAVYSLVPDADKDVLVVNDDRHGYASVWTSNRYNSESADNFNIGKAYTTANSKNLIEPYMEWYDGDCYARPMLAF